MAKRKTPKVENLKPTNITEEELKGLRELVGRINMIQREIGQLEQQKYGALKALESVQQQVAGLQAELEKVYGKADVDVRDGKITYHTDEQVNS
jgi:uncharacterized small protein (DUF1192 family)